MSEKEAAGATLDPRESIRKKREAAKRQERSKQRNKRVAIVAAVVVGIGALVGGGAAIVNSAKGPTVAAATPVNAVSKDGGVVLAGNTLEGAPTLELWEDFQCPFCGQLERSLGNDVDELATSGKAKVVVHQLTFLDGNLGNDSSFKAAKAAFAADEQGKFAQYRSQVFANQPEQEGTGYTFAQLRSFAQAAGVADLSKWESSYKSNKYDAYIRDVQTKANDDKVTSTPTVKIDGEVFSLDSVSAESFRAAIAAKATGAAKAAFDADTSAPASPDATTGIEGSSPVTE